LQGNISESDDDDDDDDDDDKDDDDDLLVVADVRSDINAQTSPPCAATPIVSAPIQHKPRVIDCRNILMRDTAFRT
jgi:hypothetical protein